MTNENTSVNESRMHSTSILRSIMGIVVSIIIFFIAATELSQLETAGAESVRVNALIAFAYNTLGLNGVYALAASIFVFSFITTIKAYKKRNTFRESIGKDKYQEIQENEMKKMPGFISGFDKDGKRKNGKTFKVLLIITGILALLLVLFITLIAP